MQFIESACDESTLQRFLDDEGTADAWRQLVEIETPLVITGTGSVELAPNINANFLLPWALETFGPRVKALTPRQLSNSADGDYIPSPRMALAVTSKGWHELVGQLSIFREFPRRVIFFVGEEFIARQKRMTIMEYLLQNYAHKLAGVERLDIFPSDDDSATEYPSWDPLEVKEFDKDKSFPPKYTPLACHYDSCQDFALSSTRSRDLQFGIPADALALSFSSVVDFLQPHASTLVNLTISDMSRRMRWANWYNYHPDGSPAPFPFTFSHYRPVSFHD